jgi:catechol 2,3-dioxygenase-like lactoylglutathione lyase family enzyme
MTVRRIQHASLPVPAERVEEVARFYCDAFGMTRIENLAGLAWLSFGEHAHIHLLDASEAAAHPAQHVALEVADLNATLERVAGLGGAIEEAPRLWGARRVFVRDPAGNLLELFDSPPER